MTKNLQYFTNRYLQAVVIDESINTPADNTDLLKYGIILDAKISENTKQRLIEYYGLNMAKLNSTFFRYVSNVANKSEMELLLHQLMHYLTSFNPELGFEPYIPNQLEKEDLQVLAKSLKRIEILTKDQAYDRILAFAKQDVAFDSYTIDDLMHLFNEDDVLQEELKLDDIRNREFKLRYMGKFNLIPYKASELLPYIWFLVTKETLMVKNQDLHIHNQSTANQVANVLTRFFDIVGTKELADKHYLPNKKVWLSLRKDLKAYGVKPSLIRKLNGLGRSAKVKHTPHNLPNILEKMTPEYLANASVYALIKYWNLAGEKIRMAESNQDFAYYRIRNGKSYLKQLSLANKQALINKSDDYRTLKTLVENELRKRYQNTPSVYLGNQMVQLAMPTSEKSNLGGLTQMTQVLLDPMKTDVHIGVAWDYSADYDLHAFGQDHHYGFNGSHNSNDVHFSGDMTCLNPDGYAAEYMTVRQGSQPLLFNVSAYKSNKSTKLDLIVGHGGLDDKFTPSEILMRTKIDLLENGQNVFLYDGKDRVTAIKLETYGRVPYNMFNGYLSTIAIKADTAMKITDFLNIVNATIVSTRRQMTEETIDLSLESFTFEKITGLLA